MMLLAFPDLGNHCGRPLGDLMRRDSKIADARGRRGRLAGPAAAIVAALGVAALVASWVSDPMPAISAASASIELPASPASRVQQSFFDLRFSVHQVRPASPGSDSRLQIAKILLAQKPTYESWSRLTPDEPAQVDSAEPDPEEATVTAIPLPRPRPSEASVALREASLRAPDNETAHPEDPTLLQKLSGMFKYRFTLASLTPNDGIFGGAPDLAALGYDGETAVYDISAHVVYLPNGFKLEAHSGLGDARDDPRHVSEHKVGSTPPAVYELKPREQLFHGVQALRMLPVEGSALGRTGLLVHSYMLGPNGDSNGCVSIRDYDRFLAAYQKGDIKRLAVVSTLGGSARASAL
jgi:Protein of unknown function (DUF2778)